MRFLHTADWHIGKTLRGRSRIGEQERVLQEILELTRRAKVDCVLVCGDLYDSHAPSPDAERLVFQFFSELIESRVPAVVIAGNHDHPKRLGAVKELVERLGVHIRPEPLRPSDGGCFELILAGEKARIATLPFVTERKIIDAVKLLEPEQSHYSEFEERVGRMIESLTENFRPDAVNLLMAHLYISGAEASGSERAIHVSKPYEVSNQRLPKNASYVALGHLHRPQSVGGTIKAHYSGSPLQLDFGEQLQEKRVVLVHARPGKPAEVEGVPLVSGRRLRDVGGGLKDLEANASDWGDDYLRVTVQVAAPTPGIADQVREILPNAVDIRVDYPRKELPATKRILSKLTPEAMFAEYYKKQNGIPPPEELSALFREFYQDVSNETP